MTLIAVNSFAYDAQGWIFTNTSRNAGSGQNGYPSMRATLGADAASTYGVPAMSNVITGFCLKTSVMGAMPFLRFASSGSIVLEINQDTDGSIYVTRNSSTEIGRSVPLVLAAGVEAYIEVRAVFSTTVGQCEVRVNGNPTPLINLSGVNTGGASFNQLAFYSKAGGGTRDHSAWYLIDPTTGSAPHNGFLGHVRFGVLDPNGNGNSSQFDGSDGNSTDNYLLVDDGNAGISNDGDTTYVQTAVLNEIDTYTFEDMPTAPSTIYAVVPVLHVRKTDAGTRAVRAVVRRSGTDYPGAIDQYLGNGYIAFREPFLDDPSTAADWTEAGVNAAEFGIKLTV